MADRFMQTRHDRDDKPETSTQPYQSVWMAHWKRASLRSGNEAYDQLSDCYKSDQDKQKDKQLHPLPSGLEMEKDGSQFVEVEKPKIINLMNEGQKKSSGKLRIEPSKSKAFPMFKCSQDRGSVSDLKNGEASSHCEEVLRSHIDLNSRHVSSDRTKNCLPAMPGSVPSQMETQPRESEFQPEIITLNQEEPVQVKSSDLFENNSLAVSMPVQDDILESTSKIVPYQSHSGRIPMQSVFCQQDGINQPSTSLYNEKKINTNAALLIQDPSSSNYQLRDFDDKKFTKTPNQSDIGFFPTEVSRLENLYDSSFALKRMPSSIHDAETMRICATADSVEGFSGGPPMFAQTTHRVFITKKTDVNIFDGSQVFRESTIATKIKGKTVRELLNLSPDFGFHVKKQGVKLQPLDSSTESEGKEKIEDIKTHAANSQEKSSAETDTMDMDIFQNNQLRGVDSVTTDKDTDGSNQNSPKSKAAVDLVTEGIRGKLLKTALPDINLELPAVLSSDGRETSVSKTQSLDVECLLSNAEYATNLKSGACRDRLLELEPCSRWVKRLKPSGSDSFAYDTKSSKMGEASSQEKNKHLNRILNYGKTSSAPNMHGKNQTGMDLTSGLLRNPGSSSTNPPVAKNHDLTLSHAWIRRLCHNQSARPKKKPGGIAVSEPYASPADDFHKKQFPSIAAMALMGKAMSSFQACEFRKKGSFVVWN